MFHITVVIVPPFDFYRDEYFPSSDPGKSILALRAISQAFSMLRLHLHHCMLYDLQLMAIGAPQVLDTGYRHPPNCFNNLEECTPAEKEVVENYRKKLATAVAPLLQTGAQSAASLSSPSAPLSTPANAVFLFSCVQHGSIHSDMTWTLRTANGVPMNEAVSRRQLSQPLARKCEAITRRSLRPVVAEKGSTSDLVSTAVKIGNDGLDAATNLVPASIPRPVAKGGVALLSLAILLSLVQTIFNTFVSLLFLGGLGYFAFQYLSKDGKSSSGSSEYAPPHFCD
ncbi:unnamed protein product [Closterium sp. NIES-53]